MSGAGVETLETPRLVLHPLALLRRQQPGRVVAPVRPEPAASRPVLEKLGMREESHVVVRGIEAGLSAPAKAPPEGGR